MNPLFDKFHAKNDKPQKKAQERVDDWKMLHKIYNIITYYNLAACYQRRGLFKES